MKTNIYACYLPGSLTPDYIGSHNEAAPARCCALAWRYVHCVYVGQGTWIDKANGELVGMPPANRSTLWGARLVSMTPSERLAIRIEILESVDQGERRNREALAIRAHMPPFNKALKDGPEEKRAKLAAYMRGYLRGYLDRNPDKAQAKREADRARIRGKREKAKEAVA